MFPVLVHGPQDLADLVIVQPQGGLQNLQRPADDLLLAQAEDGPGGGVEQGQAMFAVDGEDAQVVGGVENAVEEGALLPERQFGAGEGGDVLAHDQDPPEVPWQRDDDQVEPVGFPGQFDLDLKPELIALTRQDRAQPGGEGFATQGRVLIPGLEALEIYPLPGLRRGPGPTPGQFVVQPRLVDHQHLCGAIEHQQV